MPNSTVTPGAHDVAVENDPSANRTRYFRRWTFTAAKFVATGLALLLAFRLVDPAAVVERARFADRGLLVLALVLLMVQIPFVGLRWALIVRALSTDGALRPGAASIQRITWIAQFFGQVLPFVAGDGVRVLLLRDAGPSLRVAFKSTLLDRAVAALALFAMALPAALFSHVLGSVGLFRRSVIVFIATGLSSALVILLCIERIHGFGRRWRVVGAITETFRDLRDVLLNVSYAVPVIGLCCVVHGISILAFWVLALSQGLPLDLTDVFAVVPLALLVSMAPIAVGGWGLRESFLVALLGAAGIGADAALLLSLSFGIAVLLASLPGAALLLFWPGSRGPADAKAT